MADRDDVQKAQTELSPQIFPWGQPKRHRNTDLVRPDRTATDDGGADQGKKEMGLLQHDIDGTPAPDELYRPVGLYGKPHPEMGSLDHQTAGYADATVLMD